jgi:signal transduction histidine kinase
MKHKLRTRLSLSYVLVVLLVVFLISLLSNVFLEKQFRTYIMEQHKARNDEIVTQISQQYNIQTNSWRSTVIENIGINALEQGLIVTVTDKSGNIIWDANLHNRGLCTQMISHMAGNMTSRYPNFKGSYTINKYPLKQGSALLGSVTIGYYGPFYLTDNDLAFINTLNRLLTMVAVFSLLLALLAGAYTAKRLSAPISKAVQTAREIGQGRYESRIMAISNIIEIDNLTATINNLAEGLDQQERLRKRLTADVAHELRTPLATLQSHLEAMIDGIWQPDTIRLKSCHDEILRINRLVGDLEKLARYESENLSLNKEKLDLSELVKIIIKNYETEFINRQVVLDVQTESSLVWADRDKMSQVIINLLSNALKYIGDNGGNVDLTVRRDKDQVVLKVHDTGIGISDEDLPHIFERFYRADKSRSRESGGAGVGLAIVKAIIDAHGGKINVSSTINTGTEFTVTLPAG